MTFDEHVYIYMSWKVIVQVIHHTSKKNLMALFPKSEVLKGLILHSALYIIYLLFIFKLQVLPVTLCSA